MSKDTSREDRLAAKLRENLRKRKAQSKSSAKTHAADAIEQDGAPSDLSKSAKDS